MNKQAPVKGDSSQMHVGGRAPRNHSGVAQGPTGSGQYVPQGHPPSGLYPSHAYGQGGQHHIGQHYIGQHHTVQHHTGQHPPMQRPPVIQPTGYKSTAPPSAAAGPSVVKKQPTPNHGMQMAELQRAKKAAFEQGQKTGQAKGYNAGNKHGQKVGQQFGNQQGYTKGYNTGHKKGQASGQNQGHGKSQGQGFKPGHSAGHLSGHHQGHSQGHSAQGPSHKAFIATAAVGTAGVAGTGLYLHNEMSNNSYGYNEDRNNTWVDDDSDGDRSDNDDGNPRYEDDDWTEGNQGEWDQDYHGSGYGQADPESPTGSTYGGYTATNEGYDQADNGGAVAVAGMTVVSAIAAAVVEKIRKAAAV
ncbi:hypothetical protein FZEAL_7738 [Fusarium zealandicum]|uniref:Uncharacterized protein n=1 Tax=Fusarium zealandicum TaxID=1053134 RepID=A0A8H4XHK0_9HYPO|nr:hypothetical protein FZEAL_7738 [Fusarium zealandicum]